MQSASSAANWEGLLQMEKVAPAFEWLLWDALFSKWENVLLLAVSGNVGLLWGPSLRDGEMLSELKIENGILGSSSQILLNEKTLQFMEVEVVSCQSLAFRISAGVNGQLLK